MAFQVSHVLVDVYDLGALLIDLVQEALNQFRELWKLILDDGLAFLVLASYVSKELLEVLRIIHDQLVDDCFVQINAWELVGISFNDNRGH